MGIHHIHIARGQGAAGVGRLPIPMPKPTIVAASGVNPDRHAEHIGHALRFLIVAERLVFHRWVLFRCQNDTTSHHFVKCGSDRCCSILETVYNGALEFGVASVRIGVIAVLVVLLIGSFTALIMLGTTTRQERAANYDGLWPCGLLGKAV